MVILHNKPFGQVYLVDRVVKYIEQTMWSKFHRAGRVPRSLWANPSCFRQGRVKPWSEVTSPLFPLLTLHFVLQPNRSIIFYRGILWSCCWFLPLKIRLFGVFFSITFHNAAVLGRKNESTTYVFLSKTPSTMCLFPGTENEAVFFPYFPAFIHYGAVTSRQTLRCFLIS
jgi:hypothetical protein